ncbi:AAA family ATPase [Kitasatospora arboriphila]
MPQVRRSGTEIGEVLCYSGPGGMGKTSLLHRVRRLGKLQPGCTVLFARGGERQRNEPFRVLRQLLQPVLGSLPEEEKQEVFGNWYGIVGPAIGLVPPSDELEPLDPQGVRDGLDFVFTQLAPRRAPLVMVVDDLHWADQESLSWLAAFAVRSRELPVLLVLAYRDEFDHKTLPLRHQIESIAQHRHELRRSPRTPSPTSSAPNSARTPRTPSAARSGPSPAAPRTRSSRCSARSATRRWSPARRTPAGCTTSPPPPAARPCSTGWTSSARPPCGSPGPPRCSAPTSGRPSPPRSPPRARTRPRSPSASCAASASSPASPTAGWSSSTR